VSFLGRVNYAYDSRYLFTLSYRADASSKFSTQNHWAYFPSAAVAWRFTQEGFMQKFKNIISDGKLRMSYGVTGNNRVSDFAYLPVYSQTPGKLDYTQTTYTNTNIYSFNNGLIAGAVPTTVGNKDLKWETTAQTDMGLDLSLLENRVNISADVYSKVTSNLLLNAAIPASSGYSFVYKNIGSVQNRGLELAISTTNIRTKDFSWTTGFNIAFNKNKVLELSDGQESLISNIAWDTKFGSTPAYIAKVGQPLGLMYGLVYDGVYHYGDFDRTSTGGYLLKKNLPSNGNPNRTAIQPGDVKYRDINGDGTIDANDYTVIGHSLPIHTGGFTNDLRYKNFDLNIFFQWSYGNDIQNANNILFNGNYGAALNLNQFASYEDRWSPSNPNSNIIRAGGYNGAASGYSTYTVEDGSYLRLKTMALGYTLPASILKRLKITRIRAYTSVQNLFTWTKYSGQDPEVNSYNSVLTGGFDYSSYPKARTITFGLNVTF
jgi:TonB-linked SusC/RagA family outer membrane protein